MKKSLDNTNVSDAKAHTPDLQVHGNGDLWQLLCKASSEAEDWMKSTKVMEIHQVGCLVQVTTQQGDQVAEALVFMPEVRIAKCGTKLTSGWPGSMREV